MTRYVYGEGFAPVRVEIDSGSGLEKYDNQYATIDSVPQSYDDNGNLLSDGTRTFTWDSENQLLTADDGAGLTSSYAYDPFGRRVRKTVDGVDTWFIWSGDRLLEEHDDAGNLANRYIYGEGFAPVRVEIDSGSGLVGYDVYSDHLETPRMLSDGSGVVVWRADYLAFGEAIAETNPDGDSTDVEFNIRFPGQYYDEETGLHYNRFRYYDPGSGRYVSTDPIGQFGILASQVGFFVADSYPASTAMVGAPALGVRFSDVQAWVAQVGLYGYVANQPIDGIDPFGLTEARLFKIPTSSKLPSSVNAAIAKLNAAVKCDPIPGTDGLPGVVSPVVKPDLSNPADSKFGVKFENEADDGSGVKLQVTTENLGSEPKVKISFELKF